MIDYEETKSQPITRIMVWQAYKNVKANKGGSGIDNMSWENLEKNKFALLDKLWNRLTSDSYFPQAVKQVAIPKKGGGERLLGISTLLDRIAQEVVRIHLERIVEPLFHNSSFGYRPKRNCHQAVQQACSNSIRLLANIFLHVVFDKWMEKNHSEKTQIINLRGKAVKRYLKGYDFLGFTIRSGAYRHKSEFITMPGIFVSQKSKKGILQKFSKMNIHKRRVPLGNIARAINPVIQGIINYYHKFQKNDMRQTWHYLNVRLLKWVKWEKDLSKRKALRYLQTKYKENPQLFAHWKLGHP